MKKTFAGFVVSSLLGLSGSLMMAQQVAPPAAAQEQTTDQMQGQQRQQTVDPSVQAQHLAKRLNLSSDQQTQVLNILTARRDQMASLRSDTTLARADRHAKAEAIRSDSESKIRALLNNDQKQTFDQMQQKRMERQQNHKG